MKKLILVLLVLTGCGHNTVVSGAPTLYAYGDSVTYGALNNHVSYVNYIAGQAGYSLSNQAVSGTSMLSSNQYPKIMSDIWNRNDIVFFTPGANDSGMAGSSTYLIEYQQDLTNIVAKAQAMGVILYIGTPVTPLNETAGWSTADVGVFAQINRDVVTIAKSPQIVLVDFNKQYIPTPQTDGDTYHPNAIGYQMMTEIFFQTIQ